MAARTMLAVLQVCVPVLFAVGVVAYGVGLLGVLISETDEACARGLVYEGADFREMRSGFVPLEHTCVFEDGTTHDDVPGWVNPLFFGALAGSAACAAGAFWARRA